MSDPEKPQTPPQELLPREPPPRETVQPAALRTDISVALQMMKGTRTQRDVIAREAFQAIAGFIVEYFDQRGYVVTAPKRTSTMHSWPPPGYNPHLTE